MTLDAIMKEMIAAMKSKDKARKNAISSLIDAIKKAAIDKNCRDNIPEDMVDTVILKEQKIVQEMIDTCPAARIDLLESYKYRLKVIKEFAPTLLTDPADVEKFIDSLGIEISKQNRGAIMKALKGKVDMKVANTIISKKV